MASPEASMRSPRLAASEMVRMARRMVRETERTERTERTEGFGLRPFSVLSVLSVLSPHTPLPPKRQLHHLRRQPLAAAVDLELRSRLGHRGRQVGGADADAE